jgi:dTDP-4-amino-4,6-dideoxy-D-galactose acyltransferase
MECRLDRLVIEMKTSQIAKYRAHRRHRVNRMKSSLVRSDIPSSLCEYLAWDSEFFSRRIARVSPKRLAQPDIGEIFLWCRKNAIDCLYFLAGSDDSETISLAEDNGFRLVDLRLTLETRVSQNANGRQHEGVRVARPADIPALREIARTSHRQSRFYSDSRFPVDLSDDLYAVWIEKSCNGFANTVLVAEFNGEPAGYVTCSVSHSEGQIGLLGVSQASQGNGVGRALVESALNWFASQNVELVRVVTQGRNRNAQRLYQRCGFLTHSQELWYHQWFQDNGPEESR